jgi:hypothetical protein
MGIRFSFYEIQQTKSKDGNDNLPLHSSFSNNFFLFPDLELLPSLRLEHYAPSQLANSALCRISQTHPKLTLPCQASRGYQVLPPVPAQYLSQAPFPSRARLAH